jgi:acetylornithine deacetylase/succinyl-diaminopimelate desuccinylase-like protein
MNTDSLVQAASSHRDVMLALAWELVAIPSENPPGNSYPESVELLVRRLRELGYTDTQSRETAF